MPPRLDPARREIAVGTRRLPFRLDLRNDRVSVTLGDAEVAVRPLQWREKLTLARFAHLGPDFLRDEVIRLCTLSELPEPLAPEDADVLWELAAWMSEPPTSTPVPLDSRSLASVTIRLCRAMGLKPADFDSRSAPEVEAMWEALGQTSEESAVVDDDAPASSSSSATRIVIVPDEAEAPPVVEQTLLSATSEATDADKSVCSTNLSIGALAMSTATSRARSDAASPSRTRTMSSPSSSPSDAPRSASPAPASIVAPANIAATAASAHTTIAAETRSCDDTTALRTTTIAAATATARASVPTSTPAATPTSTPPSTPASPPPIARASARAIASASAPASVAASRSSETPAWMSTAAPESMHASIPTHIETLGALAVSETVARPQLELVPSSQLIALPEAEDPHDFFEELADRLEQAAAEMGIGEG